MLGAVEFSPFFLNIIFYLSSVHGVNFSFRNNVVLDFLFKDFQQLVEMNVCTCIYIRHGNIKLLSLLIYRGSSDTHQRNGKKKIETETEHSGRSK